MQHDELGVPSGLAQSWRSAAEQHREILGVDRQPRLRRADRFPTGVAANFPSLRRTTRIVSTIAVRFRFFAALTVMNLPVPASRPHLTPEIDRFTSLSSA